MRPRTGIAAFVTVLSAAGVLAATTAAGASTARPSSGDRLIPGDLLVSESYYTNDPDIVAGQTVLPPGCTSGCATAIANGDYPYVFNNDSVDGSFGVTSRIFLREITPFGGRPMDVASRCRPDELVTSFSSKSELALNLSTDGEYVTFMGYVAPADALDVSNANTPGVIDPTNPVPAPYYRAVAAAVGATGRFRFTETNAYSGNNGRAAILTTSTAATYYLHRRQRRQRQQPAAGGVILGAGAQIITPVEPARVRPGARAADAGRRASTSPSSATRPTRSARTTTSAA